MFVGDVPVNNIVEQVKESYLLKRFMFPSQTLTVVSPVKSNCLNMNIHFKPSGGKKLSTFTQVLYSFEALLLYLSVSVLCFFNSFWLL